MLKVFVCFLSFLVNYDGFLKLVGLFKMLINCFVCWSNIKKISFVGLLFDSFFYKGIKDCWFFGIMFFKNLKILLFILNFFILVLIFLSFFLFIGFGF